MTIRVDGARIEIWDAACGRCDACRAGFRIACTSPERPPAEGGDRWRSRELPESARVDAELLRTAAAVDDVLRHGGQRAAVVLVVGDDPHAAVAAAAARTAGASAVVLLGAEPLTDDVIPVTGDADARREIAAHAPSGRADVVLDDDLARASRLVRRGGAIAPVRRAGRMPAVTTLVQRELEILTVRDIVAAALTCNLAWASRRESG